MYNNKKHWVCILYLQLNNFQRFLWIQAGLLAHVNFIWYTCLLLLSHYLEPFLKSNLDNQRIISATTKVILATEEETTATLIVISAIKEVILTTDDVITITLKVISATTKVILATNKLVSATDEVIQVTIKWSWQPKKWSQWL